MDRDLALMEKYKAVTESKTGRAIAESQKGIFERLVDNEMNYLSESTFSGDMARLGQILVPVFRRAFPLLVAKDIVGVQPLSQPTGYAFALRYHFSGNSAQRKSGDGFSGNTTTAAGVIGGKSGYTTSNSADNQRTLANSLLLIYDTEANRIADVGTVAANATTYGTLNAGDVYTVDNTAVVVYTEGNKALIKCDSAKITALKALPTGTNNDLVEVVDNQAAYLYLLKNYPGPMTTNAGELLGHDMEELGLTIDKIPVEAQTRKLKARYTIEAAQDLKAAHGKDMASELIDILTYEISQSIDRKIIDTINSQAIGSSFDLGTVGSVNGDADGRWQLEKFRTAYTEIIRKSNDIARTTLRGPGNFIIAHPDVITMLEQMPGFTGIAPVPGTIDTNQPVNQSVSALRGTLAGRFNVYIDIFAEDKYATIGYKGASSYDTGVIWSPYVPISMKQTTDQESANPNIIFMERSAVTANIFNSDLFYRKILFSNLF
jgi:hypothetical protein